MIDIKKSFFEKIHKIHPNKTSVKGANDATRILQKAFFELNTEEKKMDYDQNRAFETSYTTNRFYSANGRFRDYRDNPFFNMNRNGTEFIFSTSFNDGFPSFIFRNSGHGFNNIYSHLYRNPYMHAYRSENGSNQGISFTLMVLSIAFFIILIIIR